MTPNLELKAAMDHSSRLKLLSDIKLGGHIAEEERDDLVKLFLKTDIWNRVRNDEIDLILGDKGSGKSAIFLLLHEKKIDMLLDSNIFMLNAENPRGAAVFRDIASNPPKTVREMEYIWNLYFLTLIGRDFVRYGFKGQKVKSFLNIIGEAGIKIETSYKLADLLTSVRTFMGRIAEGDIEIGVDPTTNYPTFKYRIGKLNQNREISLDLAIDKLFEIASEIIETNKFVFWILIDRLDVAFEESTELESNALRSLLKCYLNITKYKSLRLKIFLRSDIFERVTLSEEGFRELSHISRKVEIVWDKESIINVLAKRILSNTEICKMYSVSARAADISFEKQMHILKQILPKKMSGGKTGSGAIDWMFKRLKDGNGRICPRDFIFFMKESLRNERRIMDMGRQENSASSLVSSLALKEAYRITSITKKETVLYAEYPKYRQFLDSLIGNKSEYKALNLASIWNVALDEALELIRNLMRIGFFSHKGELSGYISVAMLFRPAFNLKQGKYKSES